PVDIYPFVVSAVSKIKPDMLILIETEIWPSLIYCVKKYGAKVVVVNGRISKNAFKYYKITSLFWKQFLNLTDAVLVRNETDFKYFGSILGSSKKLEITGNIKYDRNWQNATLTRDMLSYKEDDLILVAGSTKNNEEKSLTDVYISLKNKYKNLKLIIAPRHITRISEISNMLKQKNIKFSLMSQSIGEEVLLVDVFGKLQSLYSVADIVFVGGSLINSGGQNPIEPSAYAKPIIFGKYMFNFESEADLLKKSNAAFEVNDKKELEETIDKLLTDKNLRLSVGKNALAVVEEQKGNIDRNINLIKKWI
ncbi:3-deoxy-D-manno-octulosonic acid transferase, partial [Candidatus Ruminimicrobium bovinum]|uniref:3-deoxy-D-manno-octulosonic acid transferase n=1 Tax=Candidatus Ruminimicrobium bovinum TaxID=3242779 RepID=UPI0039B87E5F